MEAGDEEAQFGYQILYGISSCGPKQVHVFSHTLLRRKSKVIFLAVSDICNLMCSIANGNYGILKTVF